MRKILCVCMVLVKVVYGLLTYPSYVDPITNDISFSSIPVSSTLPWNLHFNLSNIAVVDLNFNQTIFDYCDLNSFTSEGVKPLFGIYIHIY